MLHNENYVYQELSDHDLFDLVKQDDSKAFEEIYARYWKLLTLSASISLQSRQKAEDMVQEIFISFYSRRYAIEFSVSLRAYLCKALKFKIMNESRSQMVRNTYQKAVHYTYSYAHSESAYHFCEAKELENNINRSIGFLPQKCRQAFMLSRSEDLSYKDISGHMGISVSTVEKHISKALRILKLSLDGKDFCRN